MASAPVLGDDCQRQTPAAESAAESAVEKRCGSLATASAGNSESGQTFSSTCVYEFLSEGPVSLTDRVAGFFSSRPFAIVLGPTSSGAVSQFGSKTTSSTFLSLLFHLLDNTAVLNPFSDNQLVGLLTDWTTVLETCLDCVVGPYCGPKTSLIFRQVQLLDPSSESFNHSGSRPRWHDHEVPPEAGLWAECQRERERVGRRRVMRRTTPPLRTWITNGEEGWGNVREQEELIWVGVGRRTR
ncbi:hypothetical protein B0H12DRAFT_1221898 [Mycena haematopus]|nr:hypothetical protein B0H12DRAFT_1221898 [Mycena haematopus]